MNNILQLKGRFEKRKNNSKRGTPNLPTNGTVSADHIDDLIKQLCSIKSFWVEHDAIDGALVSVHYNRVIPKTRRLCCLLSENSHSPVDSIRGVRFTTEELDDGTIKHKHVFTHYVKLNTLAKTIENLQAASDTIKKRFKGKITADETTQSSFTEFIKSKENSCKRLLEIIVDSFFVEFFNIDEQSNTAQDKSIITIYKTNIETKQLLSKFGIEITNDRILDDTTLLLNKSELDRLYENAPYLISMSVTDFTKISLDDITDIESEKDQGMLIPHPSNEPIIGVIDTHFNNEVYFSEWVDYRNMLPDGIERDREDFSHGTAVTSIIVDGPKGNPFLDDECGRFRVRHFGVAKQKGFSSFSILKSIRRIVQDNQDIKVWNLSLGSELPVEDNFISPAAAELDAIQNEYDVIFIVAGTNRTAKQTTAPLKVGSPADSLNSIVVNSVNMSGEPASYTRCGPVLSYFHKPDICYYGGDGNKNDGKITVCIDNMGGRPYAGTSFAAPWITRKVAYLIHIMGLTREVAKALIIDSATKWSCSVSDTMGYGIVPQRISDILNTSEDEIKFVISGVSEDYEMYTYNIPVPVENNKQPFNARITLAYMPKCNRNQGVDYTGTEVDISFGRVKQKPTGPTIVPINNNHQSEDGYVTYEEEARNIYRKWDNIKVLSEEIKQRRLPKQLFGNGLWGIKVCVKDRISSKFREKIPFGIVVTLKEMHGKNRIDDFIKLCIARGWIVNRLSVDNQIDIYNKADEEIHFQ